MFKKSMLAPFTSLSSNSVSRKCRDPNPEAESRVPDRGKCRHGHRVVIGKCVRVDSGLEWILGEVIVNFSIGSHI
jgi:hypothetical protein